MEIRVDALFWQHDLSAMLRTREERMHQQVNETDHNQLLNVSVDDWCDYFEQLFQIEPLQLKKDEIEVDQVDINVDVSQYPDRDIRDRRQPFYVKGTRIGYLIPFDGDREIFNYRPSTHSSSHPFGIVNERHLVLGYTRTDHDAEAVKAAFNKDIAEIERYLQWIAEDIKAFNDSLRPKIRERVEVRRNKLLKDRGMVSALGFPLRRRQEAAETYVVPSVRRKTTLGPPPVATNMFEPEPTLDMQEYEHILSVISNMVAVMERSPKAFRGMDEEDLRQHFLVQLNGQYEGQATGETFNFEGKTDILIRGNGKNIFIAECMFWHGPESLRKKIDQLLGYTSWRDTKTALLVFNRERNLSAVLAKIPEIVESHPNFKRRFLYTSETGFRFILHNRDDKNREVTLTVLAFEVPA
jgi:hypothetical protein